MYKYSGYRYRKIFISFGIDIIWNRTHVTTIICIRRKEISLNRKRVSQIIIKAVDEVTYTIIGTTSYSPVHKPILRSQNKIAVFFMLANEIVLIEYKYKFIVL